MSHLLGQNVDVVPHLPGRDLIFLLLSFLTLLALLVVGLFDDLHLHKERRSKAEVQRGGLREEGPTPTSSRGLRLIMILSAFSLSWRLSIRARRSLDALSLKRTHLNERGVHLKNNTDLYQETRLKLEVVVHLQLEHHLHPVPAQGADVVQDQSRDDVNAVGLVGHDTRLGRKNGEPEYVHHTAVKDNRASPTWFSWHGPWQYSVRVSSV